MSRLLSSLDRTISTAIDAEQLAQARTRRAIYLARLGEFDQARTEISSLRDLATRAAYASCVVGANIAEGVVADYSGNGAAALDKLRRAEALAGARGGNWHSRLALAWQVHALQHLWRSESVPGVVHAIRSSADPREHDVACRVASVVAVGLHAANRFDLARPWYECARQHAIEEGDELTIDANLHNVAAIRVHNICLSGIDGDLNAAELTRARWELESSQNFDRLRHSSAFEWSLPLIAAKIEMLEQKTEAAVRSFDNWIAKYSAVGPAHLVATAVSDHAACIAALGRSSESLAAVESILTTLPADIGDDDLALVYFRCSQVLAMCKGTDTARPLLAQARDRLARFVQVQAICLKALSALEVFPLPAANRSPRVTQLSDKPPPKQ